MRLCLLAALAGVPGASCTSGPAAVVQPTVPAGPPAPAPKPRALESATIMITSNGFLLDSVSAAAFAIEELRVYQGGTLTFVNQDSVPHDILSDPPHRHTDCPEFDTAGFIVPGQSRATQPFARFVTCGFHDHLREGDARFSGRVSVEPR